METDKAAMEPDQARLAEIAYHRKQNRAVIYMTLPSMFLYAGFYYHLSNYFQVLIFILMITNSVTGLILGNHLKNIESLTLYKRIAGGIWFALLAINLLTGLWDKNIYYIVLPWIFLYPIAAIMFLGRRLGFIVSTVFSAVALIFFLVNDMPPLEARNIKIFQFNAGFALLSILLISVIYERIRMRVQDELAISENQYRRAEKHQRDTNVELQQEMERRKQTEQALAESELHYRALFEESVVPLWEESWSHVKSLLDDLPQNVRQNITDYFQNNPQVIEKFIPFMQVKTINRATLKLFDADSQATLLQNLPQLIDSELADFIVQRIVSLYLTGRYNAEITGRTMNGKKLHLLVSSMIPTGYENSWDKIFSSVYDATERVAMEREKERVEQQMQNARQIQAIATLAGGIAHQFNNALAAIYGNLDLMEMTAPSNTENRKFLAALKTSAGRMGSLTDQLLAYAEGGKYLPQNFSVNDLISGIMTSRTFPPDSKIRVIRQLSGDACITEGDITQIKMVVDVVLSNAFEALQKGGIVEITTGNRVIEGSVTGTELQAQRSNYAFICIEDNGVGMTRETRERIFEPFFTTKLYGRGLGMAAAFGIIKNHDGLITIDSELNKGTKVVIYLPSSERGQQRG